MSTGSRHAVMLDAVPPLKFQGSWLPISKHSHECRLTFFRTVLCACSYNTFLFFCLLHVCAGQAQHFVAPLLWVTYSGYRDTAAMQCYPLTIMVAWPHTDEITQPKFFHVPYLAFCGVFMREGMNRAFDEFQPDLVVRAWATVQGQVAWATTRADAWGP